MNETLLDNARILKCSTIGKIGIAIRERYQAH